MNVQYGLISTSELLKEKDPDNSYTFSGITLRNFNATKESSGIEGALSELSNRIHHNLRLTENIIEFLPKIKITHYRISNSLFSILSDFSNDVTVTINDLPDSEEIISKIRQIGFLARQNNITLSIYPDSTTSLTTSDDKAIDKATKELNFHSWFLDTAGFPSNCSSPIIIKPFAQPNGSSHASAVEFVKVFYENYKQLDRDTQSRIVIQNEDEGFWNAINLFKYFHVYLNEKFKQGMVLSYHNYADQLNPGMLGNDSVGIEVNVGAFHETWKGVVPIFLWSEKAKDNPKVSAEFLSGPIPDFNYQIKWECDVRKRDKAIAKYTMPQDEDRVTEEVIMTITKNKYKRSSEASKAFNALYDKSPKIQSISEEL
jgi:UV DNA damage repair endonuclease